MNGVRYALIAALALGAGCSKLTLENYDRIKIGMSYAEVKQILGEPAKCDEVVGVRNCIWGDDARQVTVSLAADRVMVHTAKGLK
jgi:hypothetical protein